MKNKQKWYSMLLVSSILATTISTPVYAVSTIGKSANESVNYEKKEEIKDNKNLEEPLLPKDKDVTPRVELKEDEKIKEVSNVTPIVESVEEEVKTKNVSESIPVMDLSEEAVKINEIDKEEIVNENKKKSVKEKNEINSFNDTSEHMEKKAVVSEKEDATGPFIDVSSLKVSQKEAKVGEIIKISVQAEDKSGIDSLEIGYVSKLSGNSNQHTLTYEKATNTYSTVIKIDKTTEAGLFQIDSINASDGLDNWTHIYNSQLSDYGEQDLSGGDFTVIGGKEDIAGPVIDVSSLKISQKEAKVGETIKISVQAEDKSGIDSLEIRYVSELSGNSNQHTLTYDKATNTYSTVIKIDKTTEAGLFQIDSISASDGLDNWTYIYNSQLSDYGEQDLSGGDFTVIGGNEDVTGPVIDVSSLKISQKEAKVGEKITVSIKAEDTSGIGFLIIQYMGKQSRIPEDIMLDYDELTKSYTATIEIHKRMNVGLWQIAGIEVSDQMGNWTMISNSQFSEYGNHDLSTGDFTVIGEIPLQSISINKKALTLKKNSSEILKVEYTPTNTTVDKVVTWSSSDSKVATVNEKGEVKAVSPGTATITAKVDGKSATSTITVPAASVSYSTHVEKYGWMDTVKDGALSGTSGQKKRMEAVKIQIDNNQDLGITYSTHVEKYGWMNWISDGALSGTSNEKKRMEAIKIKLTGKEASENDVYYRVHAEKNGWLGWAKNGEQAGTEGYGRRLEAIEIVIVKKGAQAPGTTVKPFDKKEKIPTLSYTTHVQSIGWQSWVKDGNMAGTSGQAKRLEGIKIQMENLPVTGGIQYKTHVQSYGWQNWSTNGALSGTSGKAKRLEAIQVQLTGEMAKKYDVYYRVHAQSYGWLGWAKNGASSGTEGKAKRLEGIEMKLVEKGGKAPGSTANSFTK